MRHRKHHDQNIIGAQVRRIRLEMGLTQEELSAKCQIAGLDISRGVLSQIEAQIRCVTDKELLAFSKILKTPLEKLLVNVGKN